MPRPRQSVACMPWVFCCFLVFIGIACPGAGAAQLGQPNVLFIAIDDLNDWVGFLGGHAQVKTPHMDRLAKRGVAFTNAHCAAPLCCPSRAAVFSGQQPFTTGIYHNGPNIRKLHPQKQLLPQYFAAHGYNTLGTGKLLHHSSQGLYDAYFVTEQRWSPLKGKQQVAYTKAELRSKQADPRHVVRVGPDKADIVLPLNRMPSDRNPTGAKGESFDWGPFDVADEDMGDGKITSWAIEQLKRPADKPFFLAVGYYRPHIPLWAPRPYFDLYPEETTILPQVLKHDLDDLGVAARRWALEPVTAGAHQTVLKHDQWKAAVAAYLACVSFVDAQIGRILDSLDNSPYRDNTLIVIWGDHGWHLGEKQHWGKWTGWERATRVPLLIVPPRSRVSQYQLGTLCPQPVSLIDLYPTLLDMCALPAKQDLDGQSLRPQLREPACQTEPVVITFDQGNYCVRSERWRLIHYKDGSEELYDHRADPHEWHNLIADTRYEQIRLNLAKRLPGAAVEPLGR
jgi:arylsulfatase A-like enzyme